MKVMILASAALALSIVSLSSTARAEAGTMSYIVGNGTLLKFETPKMDAGEIVCVATGNTKAALQFIEKYGARDVIWADQINVTEERGSTMRYSARLSATVNGVWVHQFYQIFAQYEHSCYASAQLVGESHD